MSDELNRRLAAREREELEQQHAIEQAELDDQEVAAGEELTAIGALREGTRRFQELKADNERLTENSKEQWAHIQELEARVEELGELADERLEQLRDTEARVEELERDGSPGVMHAVDRAFYDLTIAQRDGAWREVENEKQKLALSERHADELRAARDGFLGELTDLRVYTAKLKDLVQELSEVPLSADVKRFDALVGRARVLMLVEGDDG